MTPARAYDLMVRGAVEAVPIEALLGRVAAVMLVPYPPGIPLIMPGERFTEATRSILDYLAFARAFNSGFPGFVATCMACRTKAAATRWIASRNANDLDASARQFETVFTQVVDPVANGQAIGRDRCAHGAAVGLQGRLLEFVNGVDAAFGVSGVELADHYCCHLGGNL